MAFAARLAQESVELLIHKNFAFNDGRNTRAH